MTRRERKEIEARLKHQIIYREDQSHWDADVFLFWLYRHLLRAHPKRCRWTGNSPEAKALRRWIEELRPVDIVVNGSPVVATIIQEEITEHTPGEKTGQN